MRAVIGLLFALALFGADFDWIQNYKQALDLAKKRNKPIMVMISQEKCNMCEYMEEVTFENEDVIDFVEANFIPLKLSIAKAKEIALKAYGTPTFYFLDPDGKKFTRALVGAAVPKVFLQKLQEIKVNYAH